MSAPVLWSAEQAAQHLGLTSAASARRTLLRWGVEAADYQRGPSGRPEARYDAEEVRRAAEYRPGRGARTDLRSNLSKLPMWTSVDKYGNDGVYEAIDSKDVVWRLWCVWGDVAGEPPLEWRYAPVDDLDQSRIIEHIGGGKELDIAAMRIDLDAAVNDQGFRDSMGLDYPTD